jgi:hypothetical protein
MPRPSAPKMASACAAGKVAASPSDAPMNGAVQGEAIATARTPVSSESTSGCRARRLATLLGSTEPNSNSPARLSPMSVNSAASTATTTGDCNWKPQPSCSPPALSSSSVAARARKESTTPAVYAMPPRASARRSSACVAKPSTLSESTGKTQGMRFSSAPPASASKMAANTPREVAPAGTVAEDGTCAEVTPSAGQAPLTAKLTCRPFGWLRVVSTACICDGLALRCADRGIAASQRSCCHCTGTAAALSITPSVSGKKAIG